MESLEIFKSFGVSPDQTLISSFNLTEEFKESTLLEIVDILNQTSVELNKMEEVYDLADLVCLRLKLREEDTVEKCFVFYTFGLLFSQAEYLNQIKGELFRMLKDAPLTDEDMEQLKDLMSDE